MGADGLHPQILMKQANAIARTILIIFERLWQLGEVFATYKIKNVILIIGYVLHGVILQPHSQANHFQKHKGQKNWLAVSALIYEEENALNKSDRLHEMKKVDLVSLDYTKVFDTHIDKLIVSLD